MCFGGGTSTPNYQDPTTSLFGTQGQTVRNPITGTIFAGSQAGLLPDRKLFDQLYGQSLNGLTPEERANLEKRAGGELRSGTQGLNEQFAGMGNVPIGAKAGAYTNLRSGINENLLNAINSGNLASKGYGLQGISNLLGLGMSESGNRNQFNMSKYQIDKENEFSFGDFLGGVLGAGGQIGSALIRKGK